MSIKGNWRRHGSEVVIRWYQRFFLTASRLTLAASPLNSVAPTEKKTSGTQGTDDVNTTNKITTLNYRRRHLRKSSEILLCEICKKMTTLYKGIA